MSGPLASIILAVHNGEAYLSEAIESLLLQDYQPAEIIVVDDGSTDASAKVIEQYSDRLHCVKQANLGLGAARNSGLREAHGAFLGFLDSDDLWVRNRLSRQVEFLLEHGELEAVYGMAEGFFSPELTAIERQKIRMPLGPRPAHVASAMLIRSQAMARVGAFTSEWKIGIDMDWRMRALDLNLRSHMLHELVLLRRIHRSNMNRMHKGPFTQRIAVLKNAIDRRRGNSVH